MSTATTMNQNLPIAIDVNGAQGLAGYIQAVNALPVLSASEERELAVRYRRDNDLDAARQLVMSQLRHVVTIARGFMGYGLPLADLIQEGNIGLMKAVKRYDPDRDVRLVSFAVHWIKAEIYDYVVRNWRIVKVATTKAQRKLFFNLRKARARLGWMRDDEVETLAHNLDVDASTVREMESRLTSHDVSFDPDPETDDDDRRIAPSQYLADEAGDPAKLIVAADQERHQHERLSAALDVLDDRSRDIITRRWLSEDEHKPTLMELAAEYSVSAERIRQIEKKALGQMRNAMAA